MTVLVQPLPRVGPCVNQCCVRVLVSLCFPVCDDGTLSVERPMLCPVHASWFQLPPGPSHITRRTTYQVVLVGTDREPCVGQHETPADSSQPVDLRALSSLELEIDHHHLRNSTSIDHSLRLNPCFTSILCRGRAIVQ
jgi:hypothetical protein